MVNVNTGDIIKEPFAFSINAFNKNGINSMRLEEDGMSFIIDETGEKLSEEEVINLSVFSDDNIALEYNEGGYLLKVDPSIVQK